MHLNVVKKQNSLYSGATTTATAYSVESVQKLTAVVLWRVMCWTIPWLHQAAVVLKDHH